MATLEELLRRWVQREGRQPTEAESAVIRKAADHRAISRNRNDDFARRSSVGDRVADAVARFGGSWTFILGFVAFLVLWTIANTLLLAREAFDPYPFIFLNLVLSMIAALQAPIIMMSQNRQGARDRLEAEHDYAVNLKAELEIMALHEKLDVMREHEIALLHERVSRLSEAVSRIEGRLDRP